MKRKFTAVLAMLMALCLLLCGCGEKKTSTVTSDFDYSAGLNEEGFFTDIRALDYVILCDYKSGIEISQADIDSAIEETMSAQSYMKETQLTSGIVEDGDTLNIDYIGSVDGVAFEGGNTNGAGTSVTIGVTSYIDGFLEQLVGHRVGENFDINVKFPDNYGNAELAGKDAVFNITINSKSTFEKYELNDEFVKMFFEDQYGYETVADWKEAILRGKAEDIIFDNSSFSEDLPSIIGDQYVGRMVNELKMVAASYAMDADSYVAAMYGGYGLSTVEDFKSLLSGESQMAAQSYLLYQAVAEENNLKVEGNDLEDYYEKNGLSEHLEEAKEFYGLPFIKSMILYQKASEYMTSFAKVK